MVESEANASLRVMSVEFGNGQSSRVIYVTVEERDRLVSAWKKREPRYSVRHRLAQEDPQDRTWHVDLGAVVSIHEL